MSLKPLILLLLFHFFATILVAQQSCYKELRQSGMTFLKKNDYRKAIDKFFAARYCPDKPTKDDLDDLIKKTQDAWVRELEILRKEAEKQRQLAQSSLDRTQKLLSSLYYGNKALGYNDSNKDLRMYWILNQGIDNIENDNLALEWHLSKAGALSNLKEYFGAIAEMDSILLKKPDYLPARLSRAVAYYFVDHLEECIRDCDYLIQHNTYLFISHFDKSLCLARLGQYEQAISVMKKAKSHFQNGDISEQYFDSDLSPEIEQVTGLQSLFVDEVGMANKIDLLLLAFRIYQGDNDAFNEFEHRVPSQFINSDLAVINYIWLHLRVQPEDYGAYIFAALLWENTGYVAQALKALDQFFTIHKQINDTRYNDMVNFANKKLRQLQVEKETEFHLPPKVAAVGLSIKAHQLRMLGDNQQALKLITHAVKLDPENLSYRISKIRLHNDLNDCNNIILEATNILLKWKNCTQAIYFKALCDYNETKNENNLEKALAAVLEIDAYHTDTLEFLGYWYAEADPVFAIKMLERYLQIFPGNQDVRTKLEELRSKN